MNEELFPTCQIRPDIISKGNAVFIGGKPISDDKKRRYRWIDQYLFEVLINGQWNEAESIDFIFHP